MKRFRQQSHKQNIRISRIWDQGNTNSAKYSLFSVSVTSADNPRKTIRKNNFGEQQISFFTPSDELHLSVLDFKKQERTKEIAEVDERLTEKKEQLKALADRVNNLDTAIVDVKNLKEKLAHDPEYHLPDAPALMMAKTYRKEMAVPVIKKLRSLLKNLLIRYHKVVDNLIRVTGEKDLLQAECEKLSARNQALSEELNVLKEQNRGYSQLRKVLGKDQIEKMIRVSQKQKLPAEKKNSKERAS